MALYELPSLRVLPLSGGAPLFSSLGEWFVATRAALAAPARAADLEVTMRVFLAPAQSVRHGLQHVTFSVDWVRVGAGATHEPLSSALLRRMGGATGGTAPRRPPKGMHLVVLYRAEANKLTHVWAQLDREGLGLKRAATLDDVLLSEAFDAALNLARAKGAVGQLEPLFHNYYQVPTVG